MYCDGAVPCAAKDIISTVSGLRRAVRITSVITTDSKAQATTIVNNEKNHMADLQKYVREAGTAAGNDALASSEVQITERPHLGKPLPGGYTDVVGTITISGISIGDFTKRQQISTRQLLAEHAGTVCGLGKSSCHAGDLKFETIKGDSSSVTVSFRLTAANSVDASRAARYLDSYLKSGCPTACQFVADLKEQGVVLSKVKKVKVIKAPLAVAPPEDTNGKGGGKEENTATVAVLATIMCVLACGLIIAGAYWWKMKNDREMLATAVHTGESEDFTLTDGTSPATEVVAEPVVGSTWVPEQQDIGDDAGVEMGALNPPTYDADSTEDLKAL